MLLAALPVGLFLLERQTGFFSRASGRSANLVIDTSTSFQRPNYIWQNLAQGGEEKNPNTFKPVVNQVKSLKPKYVRVDHIFDFYDVVSKDPAGKLIFDWSKLDVLVSDIQSMGAKPFFSLSYMPKVMTVGTEVDEPSNWSEWQTVVQSLIERYSGKNQKAIEDVYYEVWNEPDLFGNWKVYGKKNYLDLYINSEIGARRASNILPFKFGGPATTAFYKNWFDALINRASESGLRLDFISWHRYSNRIEDYEDDWTEFEKLRLSWPANFQNIETIISEAGINSKNDKAYDNSLSAIHLISTIAALDSKVNNFFSFEIKDGEGGEKFWGRWGILTHEKFGVPEAKPRFHALSFLNRMEGRRVNVSGNGSWVRAFASNVDGVIKVMIVNYDLGGRHSETVPVSFLNLKGSEYDYKRTEFLGKTTQKRLIPEVGTLNLVEYFAPNTASVIELIPVE